jgi:FAD dependent oxidoreductase TIGR03364
MAVLEEFVQTRQQEKYQISLLSPEEITQKSSAVVTNGLLGGLLSGTEVIVDPREAIAKIPAFLTQEYGVEFHFQTAVTEISYPNFVAGGQQWTCDRLYVCSGSDFETLYPEIYQASGITKVKLQMLRTVPQANNWRIGPALCAGLTLTHYSAFAHCNSLAPLKTRIQTETPYFVDWGIHVMVSQNSAGELTIGDTHEYGLNPDPFDRNQLNDYVLDYFKKFAQPPSLEIAQTWHGIYAKISNQTEFIDHPEPGVTIINALGGAGMTLSFGLAEEVFAKA